MDILYFQHYFWSITLFHAIFIVPVWKSIYLQSIGPYLNSAFSFVLCLHPDVISLIQHHDKTGGSHRSPLAVLLKVFVFVPVRELASLSILLAFMLNPQIFQRELSLKQIFLSLIHESDFFPFAQLFSVLLLLVYRSFLCFLKYFMYFMFYCYPSFLLSFFVSFFSLGPCHPALKVMKTYSYL